MATVTAPADAAASRPLWRLPKPRNMVWLAALIVALNGFFPALWILFTSFKTESELMRIPITDPARRRRPSRTTSACSSTSRSCLFLFNSFMVATLSTLLCVVVSACAAYALVRLRCLRRT
jgi:multiple sugar transport system permease protein